MSFQIFDLLFFCNRYKFVSDQMQQCFCTHLCGFPLFPERWYVSVPPGNLLVHSRLSLWTLPLFADQELYKGKLSICRCIFYQITQVWHALTSYGFLSSYVCTGGSTTATPTNASEGFLCPPGHFCVEGAEFAEGCPMGTYQPNYGQDNCTICPAGYMCLDVNMTSPELCQEGTV